MTDVFVLFFFCCYTTTEKKKEKKDTCAMNGFFPCVVASNSGPTVVEDS